MPERETTKLYDKIAQIRKESIKRRFGKYKVEVPEPDYEKYGKYRTDEVMLKVKRMLALKVLEEKATKKKLEVESGAFFVPEWISKAMQREDENLFVERLPRRKTTAWAVLMDVSGSVREEEVIPSLVALCEVGRQVVGDDKLMLASFSDELYVVKDIDEKVDRVVLGRIGNCFKGHYSALCCSIEKIVYRLSLTHAEKKVLIVVSDGHATKCERGEWRKHLPETIDYSRKQGIIPIQVGVGKYRTRIYDILYTEISDLSQLARKFVELYLKGRLLA